MFHRAFHATPSPTQSPAPHEYSEFANLGFSTDSDSDFCSDESDCFGDNSSLGPTCPPAERPSFGRRRSSGSVAPGPMQSAERQALIERVRQLSAREAEAAAALAQAKAENAALADEVHHWRSVAKESSTARRAAREALSEVSAENARLAAAYTAHRIENEALREALEHERSEAKDHIRRLKAELQAYRAAARGSARSHADPAEYFFDTHDRMDDSDYGSDADVGHRSANHGSNTRHTTPSAGTSAWEQERQGLLDLLERLQEQLGEQSARRNSASGVSGASGRPRQASPRRRPSRAASSMPSSEGRPAPSSRATPVAPSPEGAGIPPSSGASTPAQSKFRVEVPTPASPTVTGTPAPSPHWASTPQATCASTPPRQEPAGVKLEHSFESTTSEGQHGTAEASQPVRAAQGANASQQGWATPPPAPSVQPQSRPSRAATPTQSAAPPSTGLRDRTNGPNASVPTSGKGPAAQCVSVAELRQVGDRLMQQKRYDAAIERYTAAIAAAESKPEGASSMAKLLCARAAAFVAAGRPLESAADCCRAETADPRCARAVDLRAEAFLVMGAFQMASEDLGKLHRMGSGGGRSAAVHLRLHEAQQRAGAGAPSNHYAVLGIKPGASTNDIKAAYRLV